MLSVHLKLSSTQERRRERERERESERERERGREGAVHGRGAGLYFGTMNHGQQEGAERGETEHRAGH